MEQWPPLRNAVDAFVPCDATSPSRARRFVADVLNRHGLSAAQDEATLLVSELVTNAIRHANSDATIAIDLTEERVRVSVTDYGPGWPEPREPDDRPGSGRLQVALDLERDRGSGECEEPLTRGRLQLLAPEEDVRQAQAPAPR